MRLRSCLASVLLAVAAPWAQALVLAVNEGATYKNSTDEIRARFAPLAADLAKLLKEPVDVEPVMDYQSLRQGLAASRYDLALVHPAHVSIGAIQSGGYRLVAVTRGYQDYHATIFVKADSTLRSLAELKGRGLGAPEEDSITAWMVRATLRDAQVDPKSVRFAYTKLQDAVPFFVENALTAAGATASKAVLKDWKSKGGRVLAESKPVPIKHVIASGRLSAAQRAAVQQYLLTLDASDDGRKRLETLKVQGYDRYDEAQLLTLGRWLGL